MSGGGNFGGTRLHGKYSLKFRPGYMENITESACFDIQFHKMRLNYQFYMRIPKSRPVSREKCKTYAPVARDFSFPQLGKCPEKSTQMGRSYVLPTNGDFPSRDRITKSIYCGWALEHLVFRKLSSNYKEIKHFFKLFLLLLLISMQKFIFLHAVFHV